MELTKEMLAVIADIEYRIGEECYNPNSYDGWNDIEGCEFRYPIWVPDAKGVYEKRRGNLNRVVEFDSRRMVAVPVELDAEQIRYMKYRFGSNELFIGRGIIKALNYLEKRYNISFNDLEKKHRG